MNSPSSVWVPCDYRSDAPGRWRGESIVYRYSNDVHSNVSLPHNQSYFWSWEMGVRQASKHDLAVEWQGQVFEGGRKERGHLLDEFVATRATIGSTPPGLLAAWSSEGQGHRLGKRGRPVVYGPAVLAALEVAGGSGMDLRQASSPLHGGVGGRHGAGRGAGPDAEVRAKTAGHERGDDRPQAEDDQGEGEAKGDSHHQAWESIEETGAGEHLHPLGRAAPGFLEIDTVAHCGTTTPRGSTCAP